MAQSELSDHRPPQATPAAPLSVCVVAHAHPSFSKGGGETAAHREFETLRSAGHHAVFVAAAEMGPAQAGGLLLPYAPDEHVFDPQGMTEDRLFWSDLAAREALLQHLVAQPVEVFHFHHVWRVGLDLIAALMEARPDARFTLTLHEMLPICAHHGQMVRTRGRELCHGFAPALCANCFPERTPRHFALRRATYLSLLRRFDSVIYPSQFLQGRFRAWGLNPAREAVLENYLGDVLTAAPRVASTEADAGRRFAFFGQPTPFKGLDVLVRGFALALAAEPGLTLALHGCEREEVLRLFPTLAEPLESVGSAIFFAGRYDSGDVLALMRAAGWVVVPSIWWENSPVVIQEARRAGVPLIVSDIGGMAEKVRPGVDGLHFKRGIAPDLARVLREAAAPGRQAAMAASLADSIGHEEFLEGLRAVLGRG